MNAPLLLMLTLLSIAALALRKKQIKAMCVEKVVMAEDKKLRVRWEQAVRRAAHKRRMDAWNNAPTTDFILYVVRGAHIRITLQKASAGLNADPLGGETLFEGALHLGTEKVYFANRGHGLYTNVPSGERHWSSHGELVCDVLNVHPELPVYKFNDRFVRHDNVAKKPILMDWSGPPVISSIPMKPVRLA